MTKYRQPFVGDYQITQRYGETITDPKGHTGIDYACPAGTEILASADGLVVHAGWDPTGYGNLVIIKHNDGESTLYAHLSEIKTVIWKKVKQGDVIGLSGYTGNCVPAGEAGAHLHFEARHVWNNYRTHFDPMELPLTNVIDTFVPSKPKAEVNKLVEPSELGEHVKVVCPEGAKAFNPDWSLKFIGYCQGSKLHFTGKTAKRPGYPEYTYCEVYEEPKMYYVAVHDGETQILDNDK